MSEKELPSVLTADEVAEALRVDVRTVYGLLERGKLHGTKVGRAWRIRPEDVESFLDPSRIRESIAVEKREPSGKGQQKVASTNLLFWTVLSSLLGSVLWIVGTVMYVWLSNDSPYSYGNLWPTGGVRLFLGSMLLFLVGLWGFRARRAAGSGRIARVGFFLTFAGLALLSFNLLLLVVFWHEPQASKFDPFDPVGAIDSFGTLALMITFWTFVVNVLTQPLFFGLLILGISTIRAGVLPSPWRVVPLIVALLVLLAQLSGLILYYFSLQEETAQAPLARLAFAVVLTLCGAGFGLQGYALWQGGGDTLGNAIEKRLEWLVHQLNRSAFFQVLEYAGKLTIILALILYITGAPAREEQKHSSAWQTINSAKGEENAGRIEAMQDLNRDNQSLSGVTANNAILAGIDLEEADLSRSNFQGAYLDGAKLKKVTHDPGRVTPTP